MAEVVRFQLQQEAIQAAVDTNLFHDGFSECKDDGNSVASMEHTSVHVITASNRGKQTQIRVKKLQLNDLLYSFWMDHIQFYVQFSIGGWKSRSSCLEATRPDLLWEDSGFIGSSTNIDIAVQLDASRIDNEDLLVEVFSRREFSADTLVGFTRLNISALMGDNIGLVVSFESKLGNRRKQLSGHLQLDLVANYAESTHRMRKIASMLTESTDEMNLEVLESKSSIREIDENLRHYPEGGAAFDPLTGVYPILPSEKLNFASMVDDFRTDDGLLLKLVSGDVTADELLQKGYRIGKDTVKSLPNFKSARKYLKKKSSMQTLEVTAILNEIDLLYPEVSKALTDKKASADLKFNEIKAKYKHFIEGCEHIEGEIRRVQKRMHDIHHLTYKPKEPVLPAVPDLQPVPGIPNMANSRENKARRLLTKSDISSLIESIARGERDGKDWFRYFEDQRVKAKQIKQLTKAIISRNAAIESLKLSINQEREKLYDKHVEELLLWEREEKKRKQEFERLKKESRKINLKYDCSKERADRVFKEYSSIELDNNTWATFRDIDEECRHRFTVVRTKVILEKSRQLKSFVHLRHRLFKAIEDRKRALGMPSTASSKAEFDKLCQTSEETLRSLRFEVIDVKESLAAEGVRLRSLHDEELSICQYELKRLQVLKDLLHQRSCIDKIIERNQYEVINLLESKEKILLLEAEKDDTGRDTIEGKGEKYSQSKSWDGPEVKAVNRLIDLVMNKIVLIEGVSRTASYCQKYLIESMSAKWKDDFTPVRDNWCENSDFERSRHLLADISRWVGFQQNKLTEAEVKIMKETEELKSQVLCFEDQRKVNLQIHEYEAQCVTDSASIVVSTMQAELDRLRIETKEKIYYLERTISELSEECQQIREQLVSQALINQDKTKILWAMIATEQATVQHLSTKLDEVIEERDGLIIKARLNFDRLRTQLRQERKYSSYLLFIIHAQRGTFIHYQKLLEEIMVHAKKREAANVSERHQLRSEIFKQIFTFTRLSTDPDALFDFFAARLANLAGSMKVTNDALARNNATMVLAALCKSPRPIIRKYASRALAGIGWDGFVERRILVWDAMMYWKLYQEKVISKDKDVYDNGLDRFKETGNAESLVNYLEDTRKAKESELGIISNPKLPENLSVRSIIKLRRQYAMRATRRLEGPNTFNQRLLNVEDGVIQSLEYCFHMDTSKEWEIPRNASLTICIASYEPQNHRDMSNRQDCVDLIVRMLNHEDSEVQTHAAVTVANLCHNDEHSQFVFGRCNVISTLLSLCISRVIDVLEATTAALANMTCYCDWNCQQLLEANGVKIVINLIVAVHSENLLDVDQNDEVQANSAEILANVSRYSTEKSVEYFSGDVIDSLVFMSASKNVQVKRHAPLVIGNISQVERCREELGLRGVVEALFLALEDEDPTVQANCLWALCNLMWHPPNQERAGRFMSEILRIMKTSSGPVRIYAVALLANVLYYETTNRIRYIESDEISMDILMNFVEDNDRSIVENGLRCILSLSYLDHVALWLGTHIPLFVKYIKSPPLSREVTRYSLEILGNLCVHHENRKRILECDGIEAIVSLHIDEDKMVAELSKEVIGYLEDITPADVLARAKDNIGLSEMILLARNADPLVRAVAAESIGEEVWHNPSKQKEASAYGGMAALLSIVKNKEEIIESLLPALWSLSNLLYNNHEGQHQFFMSDGITAVSFVLERCVKGHFFEQVEKVFEAALSCLSHAIINHTGNSRRLLSVGLQAVLDLSDQKLANVNVDVHVRSACRSESVIAIAKTILQMLAPYNYIICINCQEKQDLSGTSCLKCGHQLRVDVVDKATISPVKLRQDKGKMMSSSSAPSLGKKRDAIGKKVDKLPRSNLGTSQQSSPPR